ncbi:MAG: HAD family hydrolase, partial [Nitrososphaerales archaeon]
TLVEFRFDVRASRRAMVSWLREKGFDVQRMTEETKTQHIIEDAQAQWKHFDEGHEDFESIKKSLSDILEEFEFRAFREAKPHAGSLRLMETLKRRNIVQAIVTNSGRRPVDSILDLFGFSKYVALVITRNELVSLKPNPEGIIKALNELNVRNSEAAYVGDSTIDIEAARAAGVTSIAVSTGMYKPDRLVPSAPDYLVQNIEDVEKVLFSESI